MSKEKSIVTFIQAGQGEVREDNNKGLNNNKLNSTHKIYQCTNHKPSVFSKTEVIL